MPVLDSHQHDIEQWASQLLNAPVTISKARFTWYQYYPVISLYDVTVLNKTTNQPALQIKTVRIFISIPKSLWQRQPVLSGMMVSGSEVTLHESPTGEIAVQGFPTVGADQNQPYQSETKFIDVMTWLSNQPQLILRDIEVRYTGLKKQRRDITLHHLSFENSGSTHVILGKATLHQTVPTEIIFATQWYGTEVNPATIKARAYLYVSGLSLSQWLKGYEWQGWRLEDGAGSAKIWASWNHGSFRRIQTKFQLYDLNFYSTTNKTTHKINRLSGDVGWRKQGENQIIAGDDIIIDRPNSLWPVTSFYVNLLQNNQQQLIPTVLNVGYVDIGDIQPILFSIQNLLSPEQQKTLRELQLDGDIQNANFIFSNGWDDLSKTKVTANVSRISFAQWHQFPGVRNLRGSIQWDGTKGAVTFLGHQTGFRYDTLFAAPMLLDQLTGNVQFNRNENQAIQLKLNDVHVLNNDLSINANGMFTIPQTGSPVADLTVNFSMQKANQVTRYLPMKIFSPQLVTWLQQAFSGGSVESGNAILRGSVNDFPFDNNNGKFFISATVKNIRLHYAPDWPVVNVSSGDILFSGREMKVNAEQAETMGIPAYHIQANIPNLGDDNQLLHIRTTDIQTDAAKGMRFIHASPLEKNIGRIFKNTEIQGALSTKFNLTVPLSNPAMTQVKGELVLKDTLVNLVPWRLQLKHVNGQLQYTENSTDATKIQAELFSKPIQLDLKTIQKSKTLSIIQASTTTKLSINDLETWLKMPFSKIVTGEALVLANIDLALDAPIEVHLSSDLQGMKLDLPGQYAKPANEEKKFSADIIVDSGKPLRIKLNYADILNAALILESKNETYNLVAANMRLGSGDATWPVGSGLYITGHIDQLDWEKIKSYASTPTTTSNLPALKLRNVDIVADSLNLFGQKLNQVRLEVTPSSSYWDVNITNENMSGTLRLPVKMSAGGTITAQFDRLNLMTGSGTTKDLGFNMKTFPAINFTGNSVSYNGMSLGKVVFKTVTTAHGIDINTLSVRSPRIELNAAGEWQSNTTHLRGNASSSNVSELLNSMGFNAHNFIAGKGKLNFDLYWAASPYALSMASMSGQASVDIGEGRIVDVGQASGAKMDLGRMLSIFSLQTIPRRLSLDFSDLFQKGYSFDSLKGDFKFNRGNAFTTNTRFEGPVAQIGISGRIGLANKDYDLTLSVSSHVTSSLPVAAALVGAPLVGLAVFAVNTVAGAAVSKATTIYYSVSGPWDNPTWNTVSAPRAR